MFEKFLNMMNLSNEDEDNYDDDFYEDEQDETYTSKRASQKDSDSRYSSRRSSREDRYSSRNQEEKESSTNPFEAARKERAAKNNVVSYNRKDSKAGAMEVCIKKPSSYEDATQICDLLINNIPVVVNLEGFDNAEAQRTMEFICGCIYALKGDMRQIQKYTFIFSPAGVNINGDFNVTDGAIPTFSTEY